MTEVTNSLLFSKFYQDLTIDVSIVRSFETSTSRKLWKLIDEGKEEVAHSARRVNDHGDDRNGGLGGGIDCSQPIIGSRLCDR